MTALEAIQEVEDMLTRLQIKDAYGDHVIGIEVIGLISKYVPERLEHLENRFFTQEIAPEEYVEQMCGLLEWFKKAYFWVRLDKRLARSARA